MAKNSSRYQHFHGLIDFFTISYPAMSPPSALRRRFLVGFRVRTSSGIILDNYDNDNNDAVLSYSFSLKRMMVPAPRVSVSFGIFFHTRPPVWTHTLGCALYPGMSGIL